MTRSSPSAASLWPLWSVLDDGTIVSTDGTYSHGFRVTGLDSYHMPEERLTAVAQRLYDDARIELREGVQLQFVLDVGSDVGAKAAEFRSLPVPSNAVRARQREHRLRMFEQMRVRRFDSHVFVTPVRGAGKREFAQPDLKAHRERCEALKHSANALAGVLRRTGCIVDRLREREVYDLSYRWLHPGASPPAPLLDLVQSGPIHASPRELLLNEDVEWAQNWVRVGRRYFKVLALKELSDTTQFTLPELWLSPQLTFDFRVVTHIHVPKQAAQLEKVRLAKRLANANAARNPHVADDASLEKMGEAGALAGMLAATGQKLVHCGVQVVLSAEDPEGLEDQARAIRDLCLTAQTGPLVFMEETLRHDRELFKTLPGTGARFDRWRLITSNNACDLMTILGGCQGDRLAPLPLLTERGEWFGFNPFESMRDNWNACIFGASGAGKSVVANLLIASCFLEGRLFVLDFAGPEKSSYLQVAELFDGAYIPLLGRDDVSINPFPSHAEATGQGEQDWGATLNFLTVFLSTLLGITEEGREAGLVKALIQEGIIGTYERFSNSEEAPILSDLLQTWTAKLSAGNLEERERIRLREVMQLLKGVVDGPQARLFNRRSKIDVGSQFVVLDLFGVEALPENARQALVFLVTHFVKRLAFDASDDGWKTVVLDEVAQLLRQPGMIDVVQELYATARKHRTSVWTITQKYADYKTAGHVAQTIAQNSTTQIFLSHGSASGDVRRELVEDFELDRREQHHFASLRTVKGEFSEALIRTEVCGQDGDKKAVSAKLQIRLSPFDYQLATSDAVDRSVQRLLRRRFPEMPLREVLERLAYGGVNIEALRRHALKGAA